MRAKWGGVAILALGLAGVAGAADTSLAESGGLRIEATARFDDVHSTDGKVWKWGPGSIRVEIGIRNISDHPITLPTRPYFSPVQIPRQTWYRLVLIDIEAPKLARTPARFNPERFDPVTLAPGEVVLLERVVAIVADRSDATHLEPLIARYHVSGFPASLHWWSGSIGVEQPVEMHWQDPPSGYKD